MKEGSYCDLKMLAKHPTTIITRHSQCISMKQNHILILFGAAVIIAICAGCAGSSPSGTPTPTSPTTLPLTTIATLTPGGVSLTPGPVQTLPGGVELNFQVSNGPSLINPTAEVYFRGGSGQTQVRSMVVTVVRADGQSETKTLEPYVGSYVEFPVTRGLYRVSIWATLTNGQQYKVLDQTEDWNSHA
jgi:hypothetical protein